MRVKLVVAILVLLAVDLLPSPVHAEGVVTVCDEPHLLAALVGGGMVTFACSGTITLTEPIIVDTDTKIDGDGQDVTFSGNNAVQVLSVRSGAMLNLNRLTIADGRADYGGGIHSNGAVTVSNSIFKDNHADLYGGGIHSTGPVTVSNSIFEDNNANLYGGGIYIDGDRVTVNNSTFSGNYGALGGGGMFSLNGTLAVSNSAFSGNSAYDQGGGIFANGGTLTVSDSTFSDNSANWGGGIYNTGGVRVTVSNSTFTGNRAGGGGGIRSVYGGTVTVSNSTFFGNIAEPGAGISHVHSLRLSVSNSTFSGNGSASLGSSTISHESGTYLLKNTIVVKGGGGRSCVGIFVDGGGNLSYPDDSCPGITADPMLGPLQDNGGPTFTMEPDLASPAIDGGNDTTCQTDPVSGHDQRGVMRPVGPQCDIGAVEVNYLPFRKWFALARAQ